MGNVRYCVTYGDQLEPTGLFCTECDQKICLCDVNIGTYDDPDLDVRPCHRCNGVRTVADVSLLEDRNLLRRIVAWLALVATPGAAWLVRGWDNDWAFIVVLALLILGWFLSENDARRLALDRFRRKVIRAFGLIPRDLARYYEPLDYYRKRPRTVSEFIKIVNRTFWSTQPSSRPLLFVWNVGRFLALVLIVVAVPIFFPLTLWFFYVRELVVAPFYLLISISRRYLFHKVSTL